MAPGQGIHQAGHRLPPRATCGAGRPCSAGPAGLAEGLSDRWPARPVRWLALAREQRRTPRPQEVPCGAGSLARADSRALTSWMACSGVPAGTWVLVVTRYSRSNVPRVVEGGTQQPEHAGGLGADAAQTGWHRVLGRAGPDRDDLGGCAAGFRTASEWSGHDIVPFFLFASADDDRRAAVLVVSQAGGRPRPRWMPGRAAGPLPGPRGDRA